MWRRWHPFILLGEGDVTGKASMENRDSSFPANMDRLEGIMLNDINPTNTVSSQPYVVLKEAEHIETE